MKFTTFVKSLSLQLALVACTPCPYAELHKAGLLNPADAAKFEAVRRYPRAAEHMLYAHLHRRDESETESLLGPTIEGVLDLPSGGGLHKFLHQRRITTLRVERIIT